MAISERVIKGGGGINELFLDVEDAGVGEAGPEGEADSDSESESFSHTISGDQMRSGKDKTSRGGALSASFCLDLAPATRLQDDGQRTCAL